MPDSQLRGSTGSSLSNADNELRWVPEGSVGHGKVVGERAGPVMIPNAFALSPLQQGMLFHWLLDRHSGTDIEQIVADLGEDIDPVRMEQAWRRTDRKSVV